VVVVVVIMVVSLCMRRCIPPSLPPSLGNTVGFQCFGDGHGETVRWWFQFSAEPGEVVLPPKVMASLAVSHGDEVMVRYANLPKATFVQFQPLTADFLDIPDHKVRMCLVSPHGRACVGCGVCLTRESGAPVHAGVGDAVAFCNLDKRWAGLV